MNQPHVFIVMKDGLNAGILRYLLSSHDFASVAYHPSARECFYSFEKGSVPEFIIYDPSGQSVNCSEFIRLVRTANRDTRILCLVEHDDEQLAHELLAEGADDIITKSNYQQQWMKELVSNLVYLKKFHFA